MGAVMALTSVASVAIPSLAAVMGPLSFVAALFFPIFLGIKYRKTIASDVPFGYGAAYKYSFAMLLIGSIISVIVSITTRYVIGADALIELQIAELANPTQMEIEMLYTLSKGNMWLYTSLAGAVLTPAILGLLTAIFIKKKEA